MHLEELPGVLGRAWERAEEAALQMSVFEDQLLARVVEYWRRADSGLQLQQVTLKPQTEALAEQIRRKSAAAMSPEADQVARELDEAAAAVHARGLEIVRVEAARRDELHDEFAGELRRLLGQIVQTRSERPQIAGEQNARTRAAVNDVRLQARDVWTRAAALTDFCKRGAWSGQAPDSAAD